MANYSWLNFISARQQLAQRLYDPGMVFTTDAELGVYVQQALRMFNSLTYSWKTDYVFVNDGTTLTSASSSTGTATNVTTPLSNQWATPASIFGTSSAAVASMSGAHSASFNLDTFVTGLGIPSNATILGVEINFTTNVTLGTVSLDVTPLQAGSPSVPITNIPLSAATSAHTLGGPSNLLGYAWTPASVSGVGLRLRAAVSPFGSSGTVAVNGLTFTIYYSFPMGLWNSLANLPNSPRQRTITDTYCYTMMENMLLEPPTGGTWTGTPQFSISDLAQALQRRRDEVLQVSNCNQQVGILPLMPNTRRTALPDNVIEVARVRYMPVLDPYGGGYGMGGYGGGPYGGAFVPGVTGYTLYRDDTVAQEWYESPLYQLEPGVPQTFMLSSEPPLAFDVDVVPTMPGKYEAVSLLSGTPLNPPADTLINVPDDFSWVLIWGALSDLLGRESEATDRQRADFCTKRYMDGLNLLLKTPWIMLAKINGVATNTESIVNMDRYMPEWDSQATAIPSIVGGVYTVSYVIPMQVIVTGGIDFFASPTDGTSIGLTVLGNAPVPVADTDFVQVSRSNWDTVLDLAQVFATFKMGGAEFQSALEIEARAIQACSAENVRLKSTGSFSDVLVQRGQAQDRDQNRYETAPAAPGKRQQ